MAKLLLFGSRTSRKKLIISFHSIEKILAAILLVFFMYEIQ